MSGTTDRAKIEATAKGAVVAQLERCENACRALLRDVVLTGLELQSRIYAAQVPVELESCFSLKKSLERLRAEESALRECVLSLLSGLRQVAQLARLSDSIKAEERALLSLERALTEYSENKFFEFCDAKEALNGTQLVPIQSLLESAAQYPRLNS